MFVTNKCYVICNVFIRILAMYPAIILVILWINADNLFGYPVTTSLSSEKELAVFVSDAGRSSSSSKNYGGSRRRTKQLEPESNNNPVMTSTNYSYSHFDNFQQIVYDDDENNHKIRSIDGSNLHYRYPNLPYSRKTHKSWQFSRILDGHNDIIESVSSSPDVINGSNISSEQDLINYSNTAAAAGSQNISFGNFVTNLYPSTNGDRNDSGGAQIISIVSVSSTSVVKKKQFSSTIVPPSIEETKNSLNNFPDGFSNHNSGSRLGSVSPIIRDFNSRDLIRTRTEEPSRPTSALYKDEINDYYIEENNKKVHKSVKIMNGEFDYAYDESDHSQPEKNYDELKIVNKSTESMKFQHNLQESAHPTPESIYGTPESVYGTPESVYGTPETIHGIPESVHGTSESVYGTPESDHSVPEMIHAEPELFHGMPEISHEDTEKFEEGVVDEESVTSKEVNEEIPISSSSSSPPFSTSDKKSSYVLDNGHFRKYRVEEKTADGFIVGEYGVVSRQDGSLRGVRYTADSNINPSLIYQTLIKFLSLQ